MKKNLDSGSKNMEYEYLKELPLETLFHITRKFNLNEIGTLCNTSIYFHENICMNSYFWKYYLYDPKYKELDEEDLEYLFVHAVKTKNFAAVKMFMKLAEEPTDRGWVYNIDISNGLFHVSTPEIFNFIKDHLTDRNEFDDELFEIAIESGKLKLLKFLIDEINMNVKPDQLCKLLFISIKLADSLDMFKYLVKYIQKNDALIQILTNDLKSIRKIIESLYSGGKMEELKYFIKELSLNIPYITERSLFYSIKMLNIDLIDYILEHKNDKTIKDILYDENKEESPFLYVLNEYFDHDVTETEYRIFLGKVLTKLSKYFDETFLKEILITAMRRGIKYVNITINYFKKSYGKSNTYYEEAYYREEAAPYIKFKKNVENQLDRLEKKNKFTANLVYD